MIRQFFHAGDLAASVSSILPYHGLLRARSHAGQLLYATAWQQIAAIPQGEAFDHLVQFTGESANQLTQLLYQTHNIGQIWYVMGIVGIISAFGMYLYGRWAYALVRNEAVLAPQPT